MKTIVEEYKKNIKELFSNKSYVVSIIIVAVLAYGFTLVNYAIGVDDLCFDRYVTGTYLLSASRWGTTLLYQILGIVKFTPFWLELIVTILTVMMGVVFTAFIKKECSDKLKNIHYILATSILISFPLLHQAFIYQSTNLSVIICNTVLMIIPIIIYENSFKDNKIIIHALCILALPFFISMYESCCQTYICMVAIIMFIKLFNNENNKELIIKIIKFCLISIVIIGLGIALNHGINKVIIKQLENNGTKELDWSSKTVRWGDGEIHWERIDDKITGKLRTDFREIPFVRNFIILGITAFVVSTIYAVLKKRYLLVPIFVCIAIFNFAINIIQIEILYRVNTSWSITMAFFAIVILLCTNYKIISKCVAFALCALVFYQTRDMNQYFYNDYIRYQREEHYLYEIANEILQECGDTTKPIVYLFNWHEGLHQNRINSDNGWNIVDWGEYAFGEPGIEITKFMNALGYNFTVATKEQQAQIEKEYFEKSTINLIKGKSVYETEEFVVVIMDYNV